MKPIRFKISLVVMLVYSGLMLLEDLRAWELKLLAIFFGCFIAVISLLIENEIFNN